MGSALCNGIDDIRITYGRCPKCRKRRRATVCTRYDSAIVKCSQGHTFITGDPDGAHYAGKFPPRKPVASPPPNP